MTLGLVAILLFQMFTIILERYILGQNATQPTNNWCSIQRFLRRYSTQISLNQISNGCIIFSSIALDIFGRSRGIRTVTLVCFIRHLLLYVLAFSWKAAKRIIAQILMLIKVLICSLPEAEPSFADENRNESTATSPMSFKWKTSPSFDRVSMGGHSPRLTWVFWR